MANFTQNTFPLQQGKVNLTSGIVSGAVLCVEDGALTITWADATTEVVELLAGHAVDTTHTKTVTITAGKWHCAPVTYTPWN